MVKKKVLITGASGYLGSRLSQYLSDQNYSVTALCHSTLLLNEDWIKKVDNVVIGDIRDENFITELALNQFQILIHLVSLDHHQSNGSPSYVSDVNIKPVWSLLDVFSKNGLEKFIYFSTIQVYGSLESENIDEKYIAKPLNAYGLTHNLGEIMCDYYNRTTSVSCRIVRLSNSYGAPIFEKNNCWWLVINDLCRMAYTQNAIVLQSDGTPLRDFIHGWDVCNAVQSIIETNYNYSIYNVCSGNTLSILEIALKIKEVFFMRYAKTLEIKKGETSKVIQPLYEIDNSLIRSIGFEPKWSLEMGINDLFDFLEKK